mgnify:CR=1 FL=1
MVLTLRDGANQKSTKEPIVNHLDVCILGQNLWLNIGQDARVAIVCLSLR